MFGRAIKTSATLGSLAATARYKDLIRSVEAVHPRSASTANALRTTAGQKRPRDDNDDDEENEEEGDSGSDSEGDEGEDEDEEEQERERERERARDAHFLRETAHGHDSRTLLIKDLDSDREYQLILQVNDLVLEVDEEVQASLRFVLEIYAHKFPELPSMLSNPLDLVRLIQRVGNEMDLSEVELGDILSPQQLMVVSVSSSTTQGKPLSPTQLQDVLRGCEVILSYHEDKMFLLSFVSQHINKIAPNLSILVGSQLAAQLIGLVGGLVALAKIPACNIQVIGQQKNASLGLSNAATMQHAGILAQCDVVANAPPDLKRKTLKILASKVALAARIDSYQIYFNNQEGLKLRAEIEGKVDKLQEPQKARTKKALPIPIEKKKARRGGRRMRKMKERFAVTELQKQQNKIHFSLEGGEYGESAMGLDSISTGQAHAGGRLRAAKQTKSQFLKPSKKAVSASSGQTGGMSSSLVFTSSQGLELVDPTAAAEKLKEVNKKWFDTHSGFVSAMPKNR